jgi:PKD domain
VSEEAVMSGRNFGESWSIGTSHRPIAKTWKSGWRAVSVLAVFFLFVTAASASVSTDQADYAPGSVVTISGDNNNGAGYLGGETVHVDVTGPNGYTAECDGLADDAGAWSCQITLWDSLLAVGDYSYTAVGLTSGAEETGTFTDAATSKAEFKASGLPAGTSVSVTWSGFNNGGNATSGTATINAPGPSSSISLDAESSLTCGFPTSLTVGSSTYDLTAQPCPANLPASTSPPSTVTVTGAYTLHASTNHPPTADAAGPYKGNEGASIQLDGTGSSDPDSDPLSYSWAVTPQSGGSNDPDAGAACSFVDGTSSTDSQPKVACTDDGLFDVALTVDDGDLSDSDQTTLDLENVAPSFDTGKPAFASASVTCDANTVTLNFDFSDPGSNDTHTSAINWGDGSGIQNLDETETAIGSATHAYNSGGPYTATVEVTDDDGGSTSAIDSTNALVVEYNTSGILQPVNWTQAHNDPSIFKWGSTIPVKVQFFDCNGANAGGGLSVKVVVKKTDGAPPVDGSDEAVANTNSPDSGGYMRWSDPQYMYNLNTKLFTDKTATFHIILTVESTGQTVDTYFGTRAK